MTCALKNRGPFKPFMVVQDGWHSDRPVHPKDDRQPVSHVARLRVSEVRSIQPARLCWGQTQGESVKSSYSRARAHFEGKS